MRLDESLKWSWPTSSGPAVRSGSLFEFTKRFCQGSRFIRRNVYEDASARLFGSIETRKPRGSGWNSSGISSLPEAWVFRNGNGWFRGP